MFKLTKKSLIYYIIPAVVVLFLFFFIPTIRNPVLKIIKTPLSLLNLARREIGGIIFYHRNLVQNKKLKAEIDLLRQRLDSTQEVILENARLRELLSFKQKQHFKVITAGVIARSPDNWSSLIIIDKGTYHGIRRQLVVITYSGLVGRIIEANSDTSKVMLVNDANFAVSAISQRSRQEGLVCGSLSGALIMRYLNLDSDIKIGDAIITSGLTESYPKGLPIGTVIGLGNEFSGLSRYAIIKPTVNLSNIEEVLIIIP
ncbi:rod shape-determining protein MreC [bacterium]|nr:MAG: rod shape-determining protein MreC [bacterium]